MHHTLISLPLFQFRGICPGRYISLCPGSVYPVIVFLSLFLVSDFISNDFFSCFVVHLSFLWLCCLLIFMVSQFIGNVHQWR